MNIAKGSVVIAKAGRDKGRAFVVTDIIDARTVLIADGKSRPLERPKRKNVIHLQATSAVIDRVTTNRQLRNLLRESNFNQEA